MYRVLLADDEQLDLEGLRQFVPWEQLEMEVAAAVNSGFAALEVLGREPIDVLVTDIKMPNMSGLELARKALERWPKLKIVFVSGHADFQYAKQAIAMNACSYVLKPVDDDEMMQALRTVRDNLREERLRTDLERTFKQAEPYVKNELMSQWLEGTAEAKSALPLMEQVGLDRIPFPAVVAVFEFDDLAWNLNPYPEEERDDVLRQWFNSLLGKIGSSGIEYCCTIADHRIAVFLGEPGPVPVLEAIIAEAKQDTGLSVTAGLGEAASGMDDIRRSYLQAVEALTYKMFYGKGRLIGPADRKQDIVREAKELDDILQSLFSSMAQYELVILDDSIEDLFVLAKSFKTKLSIYHFVLHTIAELDHYLHSFNENFYKLTGLEFQNMELLFYFETAHDMQSWLRRKVFEISEQLHRKKVKKNRKLIEEIQRYVADHLDKNITLRDAANLFAFAPNYLGHLFKEETGINFSDYVIAQRLEKAKKLLQDPKIKIYEVAEQVGYKSLPYFSRHFKEVTGMTPGDYRKQC
jgi:two-component system response regulator YesN